MTQPEIHNPTFTPTGSQTSVASGWPPPMVIHELTIDPAAAFGAANPGSPVPVRAMATTESPGIVCLCGSTRFSDAFREANLRETLAGRIVLSIGCDMRSDAEVFGAMSEDELTKVKADLDELHKRKIDLADEILVLNVGGYIGDSTRSEIAYARSLGKPVRWLEEPEALREMASRLLTLANEAEAVR